MQKILAKSSGETLSDHTIQCLEISKKLISSLPSLPLSENRKNFLISDIILAIAVHDVGKVAMGFQKVLYNEQKDWNGKRHEIISAAFASAINAPEAVIMAILTHHKDIPSDGISTVFDCLHSEQIPWLDDESPIWREMAKEWEKNSELFQEEWKKICEHIGRNDLVKQKKLAPLQSSLHMWLDRGEKGQKHSITYEERYYASLLRGLLIVSDHLGSTKKEPPSIPILRKYNLLKENQIIRPFQERISCMNGSAILRAPTGAGKTEAALFWAQRNQMQNGRLFYVLPYTASINAMYKRLTCIFGEEKVGLLHYRATASLYQMLADDNDKLSSLNRQEIAKNLGSLAREMYFPIRVCTPHQILRYTLRGKGWETMLAEFPNACFIFDEIHAYDPRVVGLTLSSARLLSSWGAKCLFVSATMPNFLYKLIKDVMGNIPFIEPDPNKEGDKKILDKKRHWVTIKEGNMFEHINEIIKSCDKATSTLIVCNHVSTAQEVYSKIKNDKMMTNLKPGKDIILLHSRFNQEDRNSKEYLITDKDNPLPKVLVTTQVVEVSLDLDFEQAYLEPAPIDALVQRMGRVNRLGERPPANIVVFTKQIGSYNLYCNCSGDNHEQNCRVKKTIKELIDLRNPVSEDDLVKITDKVYEGGYQGEDRKNFEEGLNHPDISEFERHLLAGVHQDWVEEIIEKTDGIFEVLPFSLLDEYQKRLKQGLWIEANMLLVPVRFPSLFAIKDKLDKTKDLWIIYCDYSHEEGIKINENKNII